MQVNNAVQVIDGDCQKIDGVFPYCSSFLMTTAGTATTSECLKTCIVKLQNVSTASSINYRIATTINPAVDITDDYLAPGASIHEVVSKGQKIAITGSGSLLVKITGEAGVLGDNIFVTPETKRSLL